MNGKTKITENISHEVIQHGIKNCPEISENSGSSKMSGDQFSLVWNSFPRNLSSGLYTLLTDEQLVDVTLAAEGQILRAHKLILSVCSTYFKELFKMNSCKHPIVILKDVNYRDLSAMLHFMYQGEVNIKKEDLASFLKVAETLQIKGLTKDRTEKDDHSITEETLSKLERNTEERCREFDSLPETETKPETLPQEVISTEDSSQLVANEPTDNEALDRDQRATLGTAEPDNVMQEISSTGSDDLDKRIPRPADDQPLDYTSDMGRFSITKNEPLDYTSDVDSDVMCNKNYPRQENLANIQDGNLHSGHVPNKINDCPPNSQSLTSYPVNQDESLPLRHLEASFRTDFSYDGGNYSRGRKTVKGIPGSSLPLETTLRVVSELGPTLRVERGKVIRMYSCPWCLRHFTRKENLKLHVRYIHGPLESLTCKLCGNKYKNSNSLRVHSYLYHNTKRNKHGKSTLVNSGI